MREPFGAKAGIPMPLQYGLAIVLIAVAIIGGIYGEKRLAEAQASANTETSAPVSGN